MNTNVKLMKENVVQTNGEITRNVNLSVKIVIHVKNIIETSKENCKKIVQKWKTFRKYNGVFMDDV